MPLGGFRLNSIGRYQAPQGRTARTITAYGNAQIDTAQSKFGGASAYFDGASDHLVVTGTSDFGMSGDFTIEGWFRIAATDANRKIFDGRGLLAANGGTGNITLANAILIDVNGPTNARCYIDGANRVVGSPTIATNTWYHFALSRTGNVCEYYIGGTRYANYTQATIRNYDLMMSYNQPFGASGDGGYASFWYGWLDEIRFSNVGRYTGSTITVPTAAFTNDANTLMLLHMNGTDGSTVFTDDNS